MGVNEAAWADAWRNWSESFSLDEYNSTEELAKFPLFMKYPEELLTFASVTCIVYIIIGIPGNLLTVIALARCKKVRNATAIFIINLSISDLLVCCFVLPLAATTFMTKSWTHGVVLCRLFPLARYSLVAVSLFTVLAITINRYILISHPTLYPKIYKNRNIYLIIAFIWLLPFGILAATYFEVWGRFSLDPTGSCTIVADDHGNSPKKFLFIIAFALPSIAIILCYARILYIVRKTARNSRAVPVRMRPLTEINSITEVPETVLITEPPPREEVKTRITVPCFYSPELSSCNDSSTKEEVDKCAPEFKPSRMSTDHARKIRQSFIATFRKSTAYIKPVMPTKRDKRLLTMIVAIITTFLICHLPITLTKTIFPEYTSHPYANIFGYVFIYLTPCINPILYVVMSVEYRQAYKNCLNCNQCRTLC